MLYCQEEHFMDSNYGFLQATIHGISDYFISGFSSTQFNLIIRPHNTFFKPRNIKRTDMRVVYVYLFSTNFSILCPGYYYYCHDSVCCSTSRMFYNPIVCAKNCQLLFCVLKRKHKDYLFGNKDILRYITFYNGMGTTKITFVQTNLSIAPSKQTYQCYNRQCSCVKVKIA